jgi:hypothetical protein
VHPGKVEFTSVDWKDAMADGVLTYLSFTIVLFEQPYRLGDSVVVLGLMTNDQMIDGAGSSLLTRIDGPVMRAFFAIFILVLSVLPRRSRAWMDMCLPKHMDLADRFYWSLWA